ncbi:MAG: VOC family protein [Myxococcales bacterium]|nr:VOC family protein [Myxococcales bacterium]USN51612.1 MAG: VOC family protein [Myxococcales bacterium]
MISGINHITLSVANLARSFKFYCEILGFKPLCKWPHGAYLLAGKDWFCLSLNNQKIVRPAEDYTHYALSVTKDAFAALEQRVGFLLYVAQFFQQVLCLVGERFF